MSIAQAQMETGGQTRSIIPGVTIRRFHSRIQQKTFLPQLRLEPGLREGTQQVPEFPQGCQ